MIFGAPHERQRTYTLFFRDNDFHYDMRDFVSYINNNYEISGTISCLYNYKYVNFPGISHIIWEKLTNADIKYLRILGNGTEYYTGKFIATIITALNNYCYNPDNINQPVDVCPIY